jgi:hypothetical protein
MSLRMTVNQPANKSKLIKSAALRKLQTSSLLDLTIPAYDAHL